MLQLTNTFAHLLTADIAHPGKPGTRYLLVTSTITAPGHPASALGDTRDRLCRAYTVCLQACSRSGDGSSNDCFDDHVVVNTIFAFLATHS